MVSVGVGIAGGDFQGRWGGDAGGIVQRLHQHGLVRRDIDRDQAEVGCDGLVAVHRERPGAVAVVAGFSALVPVQVANS